MTLPECRYISALTVSISKYYCQYLGWNGIINTRPGTRRFEMRDAFETGSQGRGGGLKIINLGQLSASVESATP
jgi:hypothetical protein